MHLLLGHRQPYLHKSTIYMKKQNPYFELCNSIVVLTWNFLWTLNKYVCFQIVVFLSWPHSLNRTITLRQGKHWVSCFSEAAGIAQVALTTSLNFHFRNRPYLVAGHITSPQIMLLFLLLMASKSVAANNTSQCFGVVCQGLVARFQRYCSR